MATRTRSVLLAVGVWLLAAATASAQAPPVTVTTPDGDVTVIADQIEEIGAERLVIATGNVELTRGGARLTADRVEINRETGDTVATGHVVFHDGEDRITADRVDYNFRTGTGVLHGGQAKAAPYYRLGGERLERIGESTYRITNGVFTTCEADPPPWSIKIGSATADLNDYVWGRNASFWVKRLPLIPWVPFFAAPIRRERQTGFLFPRLGRSSLKGFSVDMPFFWEISDSQDLTVGLQAYERRGAGLNAEYRYILSADHHGAASGFFVEEALHRGDDRAWGLVRHTSMIAPGLTFKANVNAVTDDRVLRDYGDGLHQRGEQHIDSNVFLTRNWESWSAVANLFWYQDLTTTRPVELYRLPDLSLQGVRQPVPGLPGTLWELDTSAVRFVRDVGSDGSRVDVHPRLSRPVSLAGLATFTPFVGGRVTGYDRRVTGFHIDRDNRVIEDTTEELRVRQLLELGGDLESVASRFYHLGGWQGLDVIAHSIEPRVTYTRIDGRNMDRIPAWTELDRLEDTSRLEYSLTNRIRARTMAPAGTEARRMELVRLVVGHSLDLRERRERSGDIVADLLFRTTRRLHFRGDLRQDTHGRGLQSANTDVVLSLTRLTASVGTRYNDAARINFLQGRLNTEIVPNVKGRFTTNWDLRTDTFVENRFGVDITFQCYGLTIEYVDRSREGGRRGEDEIRFAVNLLGVGGAIGTGVGIGSITGSEP